MGRLIFILCLTSFIFVSSSAISQKVLLKLKRNNREVKTSIIKYRNRKLITKNGTFHYKEIQFVSFGSADRKYDKLIKSLRSSGIQVYVGNDLPISIEPAIPIMDSTLITNYKGYSMGIPFIIGYELTTLNVKKHQKGYLGLEFASSIFLSYFSLGGAVLVGDKSKWAIGLRFMREHEFHDSGAGLLPDFSPVLQNGAQFTIEYFLTKKYATTSHFKLGLFIGTSSIFPMLTVGSNSLFRR